MRTNARTSSKPRKPGFAFVFSRPTTRLRFKPQRSSSNVANDSISPRASSRRQLRGSKIPVAKGPLLQRLAELREQQADLIGAGDAYAEAADALKLGRLWEEAERLYVQAEQWQKSAQAATQRGQLTSDAKQKAHYLFKASEYLAKVGDQDSSLEKLEEATKLDPVNDDYATALVGSLRQPGSKRQARLVPHATRRSVDGQIEANRSAP